MCKDFKEGCAKILGRGVQRSYGGVCNDFREGCTKILRRGVQRF